MHRRILEDRGATMVEYGLVVSFIVFVALLAVHAFGGSVVGLFESAVAAIP